MNDARKKADRLSQIEALLLMHPEGLAQAEIARRLGVHRSTINRYLPSLPACIYEDDLDGGKWKIDRGAYLVNVRFNLHEATAVHLAARLLATRMDRQNPHAAAALRKLGVSLEKLAPHVSRHLGQAAEMMDSDARRHDPNFLRTLEQLTLAWASGYKLRVWHRDPKSGQVFDYRFSPYFIEPYAVGQAVHVMGFREPPGALRTFKVERIERVEPLRETYQIPADFNPTELLSDAWGIWYTEGEPVEVVLRFSPRVAGRVGESRWHRSEAVTPLEDGGLLWKASIAAWREMLPWVRGWGADVEVIEPEEMRQCLVEEAQALGKLYKGLKKETKLIAHLREKDKEHKEPQYLMDHLTETSRLAGQFASKIGLEKIGLVLGLLHDLGKASQEFQNYLLSAEGLINPDGDDYIDAKVKKGKIDHSSAGAQVIYERLWPKGLEGQYTAQALALCLASHHSGLIDCLTPDGMDNFRRRIEKSEEYTHKTEAVSKMEEIDHLLDELISKSIEDTFISILKDLREPDDSQETLLFKYGLVIRFLFSCLIDADRINTADFEFPNNVFTRNYGQYCSWETLIQRLDKKLSEFANKPSKNNVDEIRNQVSQSCYEFSSKPKGIYQLTVPTGGGKTLASLRFALNHAAYHTKLDNKIERIFYIIPYTSIIDQNADEVRKILEEVDNHGQYSSEVVLEHHSNLTPDEETRRQSLLSENWDAPIIFTTQVQFLETLFGAGTRSARRMHQLANSVIIFDEVQTIPVRLVRMFNVALQFLVHCCGSTVVLCTATQPLLDQIEPKQYALKINDEQKVISYEKELFKKLKRVEVFDRRKAGGWSKEEISQLAEEELQDKGSVLIVVNTKRSARELFQVLSKNKLFDTYHLSTGMCPAHRLNVLAEIRKKLENRVPLICVSTQLIEAGVDIDFGSVIRYLAGLDSITQVAGRCNRNGRQIDKNGQPVPGHVFVVNPMEENLDRLRDIKIGAEKAQRILDEFKKNPEYFDGDRIGIRAMEAFYQYYFYERKGEMGYSVSKNSAIGRNDNIFNLLSTNTLSVESYRRINNQTSPKHFFLQSFNSAARAFHAIESFTQGVIVPYQEEGKELINDLCGAYEVAKQYKTLKKAQRFSVNLHQHEFEKLVRIKAIQEVQKVSGIFYLDDQYYSNEFGWNDEIVNAMELKYV